MRFQFQQPGPEPSSIDFVHVQMRRRRMIRDFVSVIATGVVVTVMVMTFYRILSS